MCHRFLKLVIVVASLSGWTSFAAAADVTAGCDASASPPTMVSWQPNLGVLRTQILVYRCTAYDSEIELVAQEALAWIRQRAPQVSNPAIVLDVDETSLSNWRRMYYKDGYKYLPHDACDITNLIEACGDIDWQWSALAPAIQPVLDLYKSAQCIDAAGACTKVDVFFVTGRRDTGEKYCPPQVCPNNDLSKAKTPAEWTLENLQKAGFAGVTPDHLYMRPKDGTEPVSKYKTDRRIQIEGLGKTIIANIGDQESDLAGKHADRSFKLPNPFYLIP